MVHFRISILMLIGIFFLSSCEADRQVLHVIHAGSLTLPVHEISRAFEKENPGVRILSEAWGSKAGARRVMDIDNPADVFLSADYMVIENMLIPDHATWYLPLATNELAIVYTPSSRYAQQINQGNWMEILMRDDVKYGRSNPDQDPCGVRSVFAIKLAGKKYGDDLFADRLLAKDNDNIRPKETDLIALLQTNHIDYIFLYKSVAVQHQLLHLQLPDSLNLGNFGLNEWYRQVSLHTIGGKPGETLTEYGEAMVYGLTIPEKSRSKDLAERFVEFVMHPEKGQAILISLGQDPVKNFDNPYLEEIPASLK
jgi:molybdate/tungstate transport system substrate-binding protein